MQSPSPPQVVYQTVSPAPRAEDNPEVEEAKRKELKIARSLGGRGATLMAGGEQTDPTRRAGARLLGNFGRLG